MKRTLCIMSVVCVMGALGCRQGGSGKGQGRFPTSTGSNDPIMATINGLPVLRSDYEDALRSGRLGGSPELVMDEMLSFTLVLNECRAMGAHECEEPGPAYARAIAFLERLYPADMACRKVTQEDIDDVLSARRKNDGTGGGKLSPEAAKARICEARAKQIRREWVRALRKSAVVDMRSDIK